MSFGYSGPDKPVFAQLFFFLYGRSASCEIQFGTQARFPETGNVI